MLVVFIVRAVPGILLAAVPVAWGWLARLDRRRSSRSSCTSSPATASPSASTATSRTARSRPSARCAIALAIAGSLAIEGPVDPLGGRPPQAPQVLRPGGRPALAVALRRDGAGADQGPLVRAHGLAVRRRADPQRQYAPDLLKDRDIVRRRAGPSRCSSLVSLRLPAGARRPADLVVAGRADRVLLGRPGADRPAAPRHLVDQLDLPRHRRAAVRDPRQVRQRLVAGDPVDGRVLAQPAPRRPDLRPARRAAGPDRHPAPASIWLFEKLGWAYDVRWPTRRTRLDGHAGQRSMAPCTA